MKKSHDIITIILTTVCLLSFIISIIINISQKQYDTAGAWFCAALWVIIAELNRR